MSTRTAPSASATARSARSVMGPRGDRRRRRRDAPDRAEAREDRGRDGDEQPAERCLRPFARCAARPPPRRTTRLLDVELAPLVQK